MVKGAVVENPMMKEDTLVETMTLKVAILEAAAVTVPEKEAIRE